jgi:hypothetical protein
MTVADPVLWEDPEIARVEADLAAISEDLAQAEADLAEAKALLRVFTWTHGRLLAPLIAELDDIEARIAEACAAASRRPDDLRDAQAARARARESATAADSAARQPEMPPETARQPSAEVKELYRALAKKCHPDLGSDDADWERRRAFMIRVNEAYERGDADLLRMLAHEWDGLQGDGAVTDGGGQDRLLRLRAMLAAARGRLARVKAELAEVRGTGLGPLLFGAGEPGLDAALSRLDTLAGRLRYRIGERQQVLADLTGQRL